MKYKVNHCIVYYDEINSSLETIGIDPINIINIIPQEPQNLKDLDRLSVVVYYREPITTKITLDFDKWVDMVKIQNNCFKYIDEEILDSYNDKLTNKPSMVEVNNQALLVFSNINSLKLTTNITDNTHDTLFKSFKIFGEMMEKLITKI